MTPTLLPTSHRPARTATPASGTLEIEVGDYYFEPQVALVTAGTVVRWVPVGDLVHTIVPLEPRTGFRFGVTAGRGSPTVERMFSRLGTYLYTCDYHPKVMDAWIVVVDPP
jgi:plastocyanin